MMDAKRLLTITAGGSTSGPDIGVPGTQGFGVGVYADALPSGFSAMTGTDDPASDNYGNYTYTDGSVMCFIPKFYYRINNASNPTAGAYSPNDIDIKGAADFATTSDAEAAGYVLHRAFIDGGVEKSGFFFDKYIASKDGSTSAKSVKNGVPISLTITTAYTRSEGMVGCTGNLADAVVLSRARGSGFNAATAFQYSALAFLALAHGQAATSTTDCAWYDSSGATNYPKGCNNNALADTDDASVTFTTAGDGGDANKPLTGSGAPFSKTTHNGQNCGVADLNGAMWEIGIGVTVPGSSDAAPAYYTMDQGIWHWRDSVVHADVTGGWNGAADAWASSANIGGLYDKTLVPIAQGSSMKWGAAGNASLSGAVSGAGYVTDSVGLAVGDTGVSAGGTNQYGTDQHYLYRRENLAPLFGGYWGAGAISGVFCRGFYLPRTVSSYDVGFRSAAYGL